MLTWINSAGYLGINIYNCYITKKIKKDMDNVKKDVDDIKKETNQHYQDDNMHNGKSKKKTEENIPDIFSMDGYYDDIGYCFKFGMLMCNIINKCKATINNNAYNNFQNLPDNKKVEILFKAQKKTEREILKNMTENIIDNLLENVFETVFSNEKEKIVNVEVKKSTNLNKKDIIVDLKLDSKVISITDNNNKEIDLCKLANVELADTSVNVELAYVELVDDTSNLSKNNHCTEIITSNLPDISFDIKNDTNDDKLFRKIEIMIQKSNENTLMKLDEQNKLIEKINEEQKEQKKIIEKANKKHKYLFNASVSLVIISILYKIYNSIDILRLYSNFRYQATIDNDEINDSTGINETIENNSKNSLFNNYIYMCILIVIITICILFKKQIIKKTYMFKKI